jgi:nucleoside recognition membrane protein YjiH
LAVRLRTRYQVALAATAVALVFYFRLTRLRGASPYELFLFLNIVIAILCNPRALLAAATLGLAGAHALIAVESGRFFSARYWTLAIAYLAFSGLLLSFNYFGVKHLVGVMGGDISVERDGPSKGTTFSMRFSLHRDHVARPSRTVNAEA